MRNYSVVAERSSIGPRRVSRPVAELLPPLEFDDLDAFLGDFALDASAAGRPPFRLIVEEQYMSKDLGTFDATLASPWGAAKSTAVAGMKKRDTLIVGRIRFWLTDDPQPDGTGFSVVNLSRSLIS